MVKKITDTLDKDFYLRAYQDLINCPCLITHYNTFGHNENRLSSKKMFDTLYPYFDLNVYKSNNPSLKFPSDEEYYSHFHHHGYNNNLIFAIKDTILINKSKLSSIVVNNDEQCNCNDDKNCTVVSSLEEDEEEDDDDEDEDEDEEEEEGKIKECCSSIKVFCVVSTKKFAS